MPLLMLRKPADCGPTIRSTESSSSRTPAPSREAAKPLFLRVMKPISPPSSASLAGAEYSSSASDALGAGTGPEEDTGLPAGTDAFGGEGRLSSACRGGRAGGEGRPKPAGAGP